MVKIQFSGLDIQLQPSEAYLKGRPTTAGNREVPINDTWSGESFTVQNIVYKAYEIYGYMRESEFAEFQNIKYAPTIQIQYYGTTYKTSGSLIDFSFDKEVLQFRKVTIIFGNILEKFIENTILNSEPQMSFRIGTDLGGTQYDLFINSITDGDFQGNEVSSFKNIIKDYTKRAQKKIIRHYLTGSDLNDFFTELEQVNTNGYYIQLSNDSRKYRQYKLIGKEQLGADLFRIDLELYKSNPVITKQY